MVGVDDKAGAPMTPGGSRVSWSAAEDAILLKSVAEHNGKNWKAVAANLPNRTRAQCAHRFQKVLNPSLKKGAWSSEEDAALSAAVVVNGPGKWSRIAEHVEGRNGKQCRERWQNHLRSDVKKEPFLAAEDALIVRLRIEVGNRWAQIARHLPGRTENAVKNRWNAKLAFEAKADGLTIPETPKAQRSRSVSTESSRSSASTSSDASSVAADSASSSPKTTKPIATNPGASSSSSLIGSSSKPSLSVSTAFDFAGKPQSLLSHPSKLSVLTSISSVLSSPAARFAATPRTSVADDLQASMSRKRSSSLLSMLEQAGTLFPSESPSTKKQRTIGSLLGLAPVVPAPASAIAPVTPSASWKQQLEALTAASQKFSVGSFAKSSSAARAGAPGSATPGSAPTPLATLTSVATAAAAMPQSGETDWLASIAAARALTSLSSLNTMNN